MPCGSAASSAGSLLIFVGADRREAWAAPGLPTGGWLALHAASGVVAGRSTGSLDRMSQGRPIGSIVKGHSASGLRRSSAGSAGWGRPSVSVLSRIGHRIFTNGARGRRRTGVHLFLLQPASQVVAHRQQRWVMRSNNALERTVQHRGCGNRLWAAAQLDR